MKALAERYAGALVDVALENKQADQVKQELAAFAAMVRESPELHAFLVESLDCAGEQACRDRAIGRANGREPHAAQLSFCDCRSAARGNADGNRAGVQRDARCAPGNHAGHGDLRRRI